MVKWTKNLLPFLLQLLVFLRRESCAEKRKYLIREVEGVAGQIAQLPCDMTATKGDTVYLVLWFKEGQATPIYSYDVRELVNGEPKHWLDTDLLGKRAHFNARAPAHLLIHGVNVSDAGVYKCRVDFHRDATRNTRVNLTVVVPPTSLRLSDGRGETVQSYVGPYEEGKSLHLSCEAIGGYPPPRVKWLFNNELLDEHSEHRTTNLTRNNLSLKNLRRSHLKAQLTCIASNNRISSPLTASVTLDMNLRPLDVSIQHPDEPLSAERYYELECTSRGSRPPAVITWYNGSRRLAALSDTTSNDGNLTTSIVRLNFSASDNGQLLSCRAENHNIPTAVIEDTWKLNVQYKPSATVVLGPSLDPKEIKEGDDVYFECQIKANPRAYKIIWKHNEEQLHHNISAGMLISDPSLVLQSVTRQHAGRYVCEASNVEGDGSSRPYVLTIKFAPVCRTGENHVYAIDKRKNAEVICEVDANPEVVKYYWTFNNTAESIDVPHGRYTVESHRSVVTYTPKTELDYGSLLCWGQNVVGRQKEPCVFQIVAATEPHPPTNCTVHSQSENSFSVSCVEGFHGGLNQTFYMEVYSSTPPELIDNVTSKDAKFRVKGLESGTEFQLSIFSANAKGRSAITQLVTVTAKLPVKQLETRSGKGETQEKQRLTLTPLLGVLMGIIVVIVIIVVVIVAIIKMRCTGHQRRNDNDPDAPARLTSSGGVPGEGNPCKTAIKMTSDIAAPEETDPDILQRKQTHEEQISLSSHLYRRPDNRTEGNRAMESSGGTLSGGVSTISVTGPRYTSASHASQPPQPPSHLQQRLPPPPQAYGPQPIPSHPQCQTHAPYGTISGPGGMPIPPPPPPHLHYFHDEGVEDSPPPPPPPPCPEEPPHVPLVYVSEGGHVRTGLSLPISNTSGNNPNSAVGGLSRIPEDPEIPLLSPSRRESAV